MSSCRLCIVLFSPLQTETQEETETQKSLADHTHTGNTICTGMTCVNMEGSYHCECSQGFRMHTDGRTCIAVNSCSVKNGGCEHKCVDMGNDHYKCECLRDPCVDRNGGCAQLCRSMEGQAECSCRPGYTLARDRQGCDGKSTRTYIDECSSSQAMCTHRCVNTLGSFSCVCNPGFELGADSKQCYRIEMEIVNSCEKNKGGCSHHCEHTTNGPFCSCNQGHQLAEDRKTCVDLREDVVRYASHLEKYIGRFDLKFMVQSRGTALAREKMEESNEKRVKKCSTMTSLRETTTKQPDLKEAFEKSMHPVTALVSGRFERLKWKDIDECLAESSACEHYCVNTLGSYECFCRLGFRLDYDQRACIPLYDSDLDDDEEDDAEEDLEVHSLPDLLFRQPPQLLQYTAGLHSPYGDDEEEEAQRGELTLVSHIVCLDDSFGDDCSVSCADCENGAVCGVDRDRCECTHGWTGVICNERVQGQLCEDGCPQGSFGKHCRRKCNCPNNGRCHRLYGACLCAPGLYGRFCHLPCPRWTHGVGCSEECDCVLEHSLGCHPKNGTCLCKPGYHGSQCQQACRAGQFGENCLQTCVCGGAPCDPMTGQCICPVGKTGKACHQDCPEGLWGLKCQFPCRACENGASCNKQTGVCDCSPGYTEQLCQTVCPTGSYGPGCVSTCVCHPDASCDPVTGHCTCPPGRTGHDCTTCKHHYHTYTQAACEVGSWGSGCSSRCQCADRALSCDAVTGHCVCEAGFTGDNCEQKCVEGSYGLSCALDCLCQHGALCDHVSGACTCSSGWAGTFCEK
ncbi:unnamed protein product, partial [Coregonus sp. 'balchen']